MFFLAVHLTGESTQRQCSERNCDELQGKITAYEGQVMDLKNQLEEIKLKSAIFA